MRAALKVCLMEGIPGAAFGEVRTSVEYSLCGRTDKGVSGLGNVNDRIKTRIFKLNCFY